MSPTICTAGGRPHNLVNPHRATIDITDIAHALSNLCRFNGHTRKFYSVAQHSVNVATILERHPDWHGISHEQRRHLRQVALLHDAAEAYLGDVSTPLKRQLVGYRHLEQQHLSEIFLEFGLDPGIAFEGLPRIVKDADGVCLQWERRDLLPEAGWWPAEPMPDFARLKPMPPDIAKARFLDTFNALFREVAA